MARPGSQLKRLWRRHRLDGESLKNFAQDTMLCGNKISRGWLTRKRCRLWRPEEVAGAF